MIDRTFTELSKCYFLITFFVVRPVVTPSARATRKFSWGFVSDSTSRWKNTLLCSVNPSRVCFTISSVTTASASYHTIHDRCWTCDERQSVSFLERVLQALVEGAGDGFLVKILTDKY